MSTPLTDSINALTAYANETTGAFDTTLSDAVGRLCEGYGGGAFYSGTYTPTENSPHFTIDVGATNYSHFLIVAHKLPYDVPYSRCLGMRLYDFDAEFALMIYGASSESDTPSNANAFTDSSQISFSAVIERSGTMIKSKRLIASQSGQMQADIQYDWYAW